MDNNLYMLKLIYIFISVCIFQRCHGGKILLYPLAPGFTSHLMDMRHVGEILYEYGHDISVITNEELKKYFKEYPTWSLHVAPTPGGRWDLQNPEILTKFFNDDSFSTSMEVSKAYIKSHEVYCEALLKSGILPKLKLESFDLLIADMDDLCSNIVTLCLNITTIPLATTGIMPRRDFPPMMPSIMPVMQTDYSDQMDFWQRLDNTFRGWMFYHLHFTLLAAFDNFMKEYNIAPTQSYGDAYRNSLMMASCSYDIDFPRPMMPNTVCIGGLHVAPVKPLPEKLQNSIDESGYKGFVIISLGTMVHYMENSDLLSKILAEFPKYQFIWKYKGTVPKELPKNILVKEWLPQNDLLAHPKVKALVSNCGRHATIESVHYGVPIIGVPHIGDRFNQASMLVNKLKIGLTLNARIMNEDTLRQTISQILYNKTYYENAKKASALYHDQPMSVQEKFLFYVDYVIRHKGAPHFISPTFDMNWMQFYSVDVALFLFTTVSVLVYVLSLMIRCIFYKIKSNLLNSSTKDKDV